MADTWTSCSREVPEECTIHAMRLESVSNSFGYRIQFSYAANSGGSPNQPPSGWQTRTGAAFYNDAAGTAALGSVSYAYPASGVTDLTDRGGAMTRGRCRGSHQFIAARG